EVEDVDEHGRGVLGRHGRHSAREGRRLRGAQRKAKKLAMPSFDIVSKLNTMELDNALVQAQKEVGQRFDFKNSETSIEHVEKAFVIKSNTEDRLAVARDVLYTKLGKRGVSLKHLDPQEVEPSGKGVKQTLNIVEGIAQDKAKTIVAAIKNSKLK